MLACPLYWQTQQHTAGCLLEVSNCSCPRRGINLQLKITRTSDCRILLASCPTAAGFLKVAARLSAKPQKVSGLTHLSCPDFYEVNEPLPALYGCAEVRQSSLSEYGPQQMMSSAYTSSHLVRQRHRL